MTKKAVPLGFCADCRWARDLPSNMPPLGPFTLDCQADPWHWEPREQEGKVRDPVSGKAMRQMAMLYIPRPHLPTDYCSRFAPQPATELRAVDDAAEDAAESPAVEPL